jgi:hypothetical protein
MKGRNIAFAPIGVSPFPKRARGSAISGEVPAPRRYSVFKPNYNQQRAERRRSQQAKQEAKLREQQEAVSARRAARAETVPADETKTSDGK